MNPTGLMDKASDRLIRKPVRWFRRRAEQQQLDRLAATYDIQGHRRMYLYHVRKTGGTSLVLMMLQACGADHPQLAYKQLALSPELRVVVGDRIIVSQKKSIERGSYFFGFSHIPAHQLQMPPGTFTVVCLRDPLQRVVSHYKMLMSYVEDCAFHSELRGEFQWLGRTFGDFLDNMPRAHLLNQLYMFSPQYCVAQAADALRSCSHVMRLEAFHAGVQQLETKTGLRLETLHGRRSRANPEITPAELRRCRELLQPEYELMDRLNDAGDVATAAA